MFTTKNCTLVGIKVPSDRDQFGGTEWTEHRFDVSPRIPLETWVDFSAARKVELRGEESLVEAVWEIRRFIQEQAVALITRNLRAGDMVQFASSPEISLPIDNGIWFTLSRGELDAGIFNSIPMQKFNLVASVRT